MNESIPVLTTFDEPSLDAAFTTLAEEVRTADTSDVEAFRLHWLGRKLACPLRCSIATAASPRSRRSPR